MLPKGERRFHMIVRRLLVLVVALTVAMAMAIPAGAAKPAPSLSGTSHHDAGGGDIGLPDFQFQAWEGTISFGDEVFDIEWWFDVNTWTAWPPVFGEFPPNASQYTMEVRVFDKDGKTVLRTLEHGTTTIANLTWRANGKVVHAEGFFEGWEGRRVHESGVFVMHDSGFFPVSGDSSFRIN
jgi:hypothetical protein